MTRSARAQRSDARSNHGRILAAAADELGRNPNASLEDIARAAGVVRRTIYAHFPSRPALITALAEDARQQLAKSVAESRRPRAGPAEALATMVLSSLKVADRYRMLVALGRGGLGEDNFQTTLAPARAEATSIIQRGQREGVFADVLAAPVLALATEAVVLSMLESYSSTDWTDATACAAATSVLIAAGVDPASARRQVQDIAGGTESAS